MRAASQATGWIALGRTREYVTTRPRQCGQTSSGLLARLRAAGSGWSTRQPGRL